MSVLKITSDMIKPFSGEGDVVAWLQKIKLVSKLSKVEEIQNLIPLYLEGSALAVYMEMSEDDKRSAEKIEERLKEVYTDGPFVAFAKLSNLKWKGEAVDAYANELRRLAGLAGFQGDSLEQIVRLSFVNGFPDSISAELQQIDGVKTMQLNALIPKARIFASVKAAPSSIGAVAARSPKRWPEKEVSGDAPQFKGKCFKCDGPHMARHCPQKKVVRCFKCQGEGHMSFNCTSPGNE